MGSHMKEAIEQMQQKEEAGLNYLYAKTFNYVYLRAKSVLNKEADVQKLMKEVYTQAYAMAGQVKEEEMYEWLGKLTYSQGAKYFRKKKAREATALEFEKADLIIGKSVTSSATVEVIGNALEQLPELYQATFYAFYYDFMNIVEIAEMFDCTVGVVLYRLNYTAKFLREACVIYNEDAGKERKEKAIFSVETVCSALRKWSIEHCMGMATAQTLYSNICKELKLKAGSIPFEGVEFAGVNNTIVWRKTDDLNPVFAEIELYSPKEKMDKKKLMMFAGIAAAVVVLVIVLAVVFGGKDKEGQLPVQEGTENDDIMLDEPEVQDQEVEESETTDPGTIEPETEEPETAEPETEEPETTEPETEEPEVEEPETTDPEVEEPEAEKPEADASEYILPTSNTAALTEEELASLTKEELRLARNEIYARHGMIFGVEDLDTYFAAKSWYTPTYEIADFYENVEMDPLEESNIELILMIEQNMSEE